MNADSNKNGEDKDTPNIGDTNAQDSIGTDIDPTAFADIIPTVFVCGDRTENICVLDGYLKWQYKNLYFGGMDIVYDFIRKTKKLFPVKFGSAFELLPILDDNPTKRKQQASITSISHWKPRNDSDFHDNQSYYHDNKIDWLYDEPSLSDGKGLYETDELSKSDFVAIYDVSSNKDYWNPNTMTFKDDAWVVVRGTLSEDGIPTAFLQIIRDNENIQKMLKTRNSILVIRARDLRDGNCNIKRGLSWEQLTRESIEALHKFKYDDKNKKWYDCFKYKIVCFENEGCLLICPPERLPEKQVEKQVEKYYLCYCLNSGI